MKTHWLIQSTGFNSNYVYEIFNFLKENNYKVSDFGIVSGTNNITNIENILSDDDIYIFKSGTKILDILNNIENISEVSNLLSSEQINKSNLFLKKLKDGIDYNINTFDQQIYSKLNLPLLNNSPSIYSFNEIKDTSFKKDLFIKPSRDLKAFNGGIIKSGTKVIDYIMSNHPLTYYKNEKIILHDVVEILAEYRFFIIEDKVITGSLYKRNNQIIYDYFIPDYIYQVALEYAKLYKPANIFVMDIAETNLGIKIIEYNCWNASGIYMSDVHKLFSEIDNYKLSTYKEK
jgi:hypothetical protein